MVRPLTFRPWIVGRIGKPLNIAPTTTNNAHAMKTLEYNTSTACCGQPTNDMGICTDCHDHAGEVYYTPDGDELTEAQAWAVDTIAKWAKYAADINVEAAEDGTSIIAHNPKNKYTVAQIKALVGVAEMYEVPHYLHNHSYSFCLHISPRPSFTVAFDAPKDDPKDAREVLFNA